VIDYPTPNCRLHSEAIGNTEENKKLQDNCTIRVTRPQPKAKTALTDFSLTASGNTYNPSLIVLREKGYELWLEKGENGSLWCARK
jgi:hypothetical protein